MEGVAPCCLYRVAAPPSRSGWPFPIPWETHNLRWPLCQGRSTMSDVCLAPPGRACQMVLTQADLISHNEKSDMDTTQRLPDLDRPQFDGVQVAGITGVHDPKMIANWTDRGFADPYHEASFRKLGRGQ